MPSLELWQSAGVALAIGLLVGAERERAKGAVGSPGVRTYALAALLGNLAAILSGPIAFVLLAGVVALLALEYAATRSRSPGLTSEVALLLTVALGALTHEHADLAVGAAVATTVLLVSKDSLHRFVRETVTDLERTDALKFFVAAFVVLPLLPTGQVGPYGVWVPQRLWLLVVVITGIGWVGYAAIRALGARRGLLLAGLAGGFVSATATTGAVAARARSGAVSRPVAVAGALMASVATLVQLALVTSVVEPRVTAELAPALVAGTLVLVVGVWWSGRAGAEEAPRDDPVDSPPESNGVFSRPFALVPALVLTAVISLVLLLATWLNHRYGASGATAAAAAGSLADVHAASVAVATLAHSGDLTVEVAVRAIAVGLAANTLGKLVVGALGGGWRFAAALAGWFAVTGAALAVAVLLTP